MRHLNQLKLKRVVDTGLYYQILRRKKMLFKTSSYLSILFFISSFLSPSLEIIYVVLFLALLLEVISWLAYEGSLDNFILRRVQKRKHYV